MPQRPPIKPAKSKRTKVMQFDGIGGPRNQVLRRFNDRGWDISSTIANDVFDLDMVEIGSMLRRPGMRRLNQYNADVDFIFQIGIGGRNGYLLGYDGTVDVLDVQATDFEPLTPSVPDDFPAAWTWPFAEVEDDRRSPDPSLGPEEQTENWGWTLDIQWAEGSNGEFNQYGTGERDTPQFFYTKLEGIWDPANMVVSTYPFATFFPEYQNTWFYRGPGNWVLIQKHRVQTQPATTSAGAGVVTGSVQVVCTDGRQEAQGSLSLQLTTYANEFVVTPSPGADGGGAGTGTYSARRTEDSTRLQPFQIRVESYDPDYVPENPLTISWTGSSDTLTDSGGNPVTTISTDGWSGGGKSITVYARNGSDITSNTLIITDSDLSRSGQPEDLDGDPAPVRIHPTPSQIGVDTDSQGAFFGKNTNITLQGQWQKDAVYTWNDTTNQWDTDTAESWQDETDYVPSGDVSFTVAEGWGITPSSTPNTGWVSGGKTVAVQYGGGSGRESATTHATDPEGRTGVGIVQIYGNMQAIYAGDLFDFTSPVVLAGNYNSWYAAGETLGRELTFAYNAVGVHGAGWYLVYRIYPGGSLQNEWFLASAGDAPLDAVGTYEKKAGGGNVTLMEVGVVG